MLSAIKRMALAAIDPHYEAKARELARLRAVAQQNGDYSAPNSWRRILGSDGGLQGFDFYCCQQYQLRDINLWLRVHTCPQCKARISVFDACGIKPGTPPAKWPDRFNALPVMRQPAQKQSGPVDTWAAGVGDVEYEMTDPFAFSRHK